MSCINSEYYEEVIDVLTTDAVERLGMPEERAIAFAQRDWESIVAENSTEREYEMYETLTRRLDRSVEVYFGGGSKPTTMRVVKVDEIEDGFRVHLYDEKKSRKYNYSFNSGQARSKQTKNGSFVEIPAMQFAANSIRLGSNENFKFDRERYEQQELDLLNDLDNAMDMFERLSQIDDTVSEEHNNRLKRVLRMFTAGVKDYIPDMNFYLNKEAEKSGGVLLYEGRDTDGVYIGVSPKARATLNQMSAQEVYVHELGHAATVFGMNAPEAKNAKRRLQQLRRQVREQLTVEDFLPEISIDPELERQNAQEMWDYLFNNENTGLEEFLMYALTNEQLASKLDKMVINKPIENEPSNMFDALMTWFRNIVNLVSTTLRNERIGQTGTELVLKLAMDFAEANNKAAEFSKESAFLKQFRESSENLNSKLSKIIKEHILRFEDTPELIELPVPGAPKTEYVKWAWKVGPRLFADRRLRPAYRHILNALGLSYMGDVQTAIQHMVEADTVQRGIETLGLLAENIDRARETRARLTAQQIREAFKELSVKEREVLTLIGLDTDLSSIYEDIDDLPKLLRNEEALAKEINKRLVRLKKQVDKETGEYFSAQVAGLGYYMATHKGSIAQLLNARNIAEGVNRRKRTPEYLKHEKEIDQLATLFGLLYSNQEAKDVMADLIEREPEGVKFTMRLHNDIKEYAKATAFSNNDRLLIKGYTKEIFDEDITVRVAPIRDRNKLNKDGFKLVKVLEKAEGDTSTTPMGLYVSKNHVQQNYKKSAMRLTDMSRRGTTLTDVRRLGEEALADKSAEVDKLKLDRQAIRLVRQMESGKYDFKEATKGSLLPLYNNAGEVVNYRYVMDKASKRKYLGQDIKGPTVLGRLQASIDDKMLTEEHNNKVFDLAYSEMKKNYIKGNLTGRDGNAYIVIEPNSTNAEVREIYRLLPEDIKERIKNTPEGKLAVRADLIRFYFGMREVSIADAIEHIPVLGPTIRHMTPAEIKRAVQLVEKIWASVVSVAKVDIVIRTPAVLLGNVISNLMYSVQSGYSPLKVLQLQLDAVKGLKDYINMTHELVRLENKKAVGQLDKKDWDKINILKEDLKKHPVAELVDAGMFQAIIEDVGADEFKSSNRISRFISNKLDVAPQWIRDGANILYVTEKTRFFQLMTTATQFSDFAARFAQHELNKERLYKQIENARRGKYVETKDLAWLKGTTTEKYLSRKEAREAANEYSRRQVLDAFVNYSKPEGKIVDWLNRMGFVMFTKYFMRIQRAIGQQFVDNPLYLLMSLLGQTMLYDIDSIDDQHLLVKDLDYVWKNPIEHIERLIMPTAFEYAVEPFK